MADDIHYRPSSDGVKWASTFAPATALVLGNVTDGIASMISELDVGEARTAATGSYRRHLHDGTYVVLQNGEWHLVFVVGAKPDASPAQDQLATSDTHLAECYYTLEDLWPGATPLLGEAMIREGDLVRPRSRNGWGTVRSVRRRMDGHDARVEIEGRLESFDVSDLVVVEGDYRDPHFWLKLGPGSSEAFLRSLTWLKLDEALVDTLYSFAATKTVFKPYQFIPVLKMLSSASGRILIADEVGLGKTIEAGLIWTELQQRQPMRRVLVVVPAQLVLKWRQEMSRRFMREVPELRIYDVREFVAEVRSDADPDLVGVISLQTLLRAKDVLADLGELRPQFDLVIVDEAHALRNRGTTSFFIGSLLADLADHLIFLSATPLNLRSSDLFNLVSMLDEGAFPDESVFADQLEPNTQLNAIARNFTSPTERSRKVALALLESIPRSEHGQALRARPDFDRLRDVLSARGAISTDDVARVKRLTAELNTLGAILTRTRKVDVPDKKAIREVEEILVDWTARERSVYDAIYEDALRRALASRMPLGFAMQMPLRQACSSLIVSQRKISAREGWDLDDDFAIGEAEVDDEEVPQQEDQLPVDAIRNELDHDTKLQKLRQRLQLARANGMPQALIFSFFRGTVEYLATELRKDARTAYLHGGIPMEDRSLLIDRFRRGDIDILISNQVGSEGLDFEFCNVLVNYDLPWNPMQVEQRIGRLDRFGQKHDKIFIFNMMTPGTIESDIFGRLYDRISVFERSIGDLEPIMRATTADLQAILNPTLSVRERDHQIDRYAVAMARRADDLKLLEESSGMLTSMSLLDIEGLNEAGPTNGRYIGASELRSLVDVTIVRYKGTIAPSAREGVFTICGGDELARALRHLADGSGSMFGLGKLVAQLREPRGVSVTFSSEVASLANADLISARHPLIRLAVQDMREQRETLPRLGIIRTSALPKGSSYLVGLSRARTAGGVRDSVELWVTAVNLASGIVEEEVASMLLVGLAEGTLKTASDPLPADLSPALGVLEKHVASRRRAEQALRSQENSALVQARIASEQQSVVKKLARVKSRLNSSADSQDPRIARMLAGQIRNLKLDLADVPHKYETKLKLTLSVEDSALAVLLGDGG